MQVTISFAKIILNSIRPSVEGLGKLPGTDIFCDINQYPMAIKTPGILIVRINSGLLCFANANFVRERCVSSHMCFHKREKREREREREALFNLTNKKLIVMVICFRIMKRVTEKDEEGKENSKERTQAVILDMSSKL